MKKNFYKYWTFLCLYYFIILGQSLLGQVGFMGAGNIIGSNIDINTSTYLTSDASLGSTFITVNSSSLSGSVFSGNLASGDLILIIQMQGATINIANNASYGAISNYNSAGLYEFRCVSSVPNSTTINFNVPLANNYSSNGKTQVIRVPRYTSFNLASGNSIRPATWNGDRGGITVIEIGGNGTINGTIDASGSGFRGGANDNTTQSASMNITSFYSSNVADGGRKGESIAGGDIDYDALGGRYGRGAPANGGGGGNSHNAGGGGGANGGVISAWNGLGNPNNGPSNWTTAWNLEGGSFSTNTSSGGGRGGYTFSADNRDAITTAPGNSVWGGNSRRNLGGYGGRPLAFSNTRIFFGGGGGAGDGNNSAATGGANGGGMVLIICYGNLSGSGIITSSGGNSPNTMAGHNDAPGGGGGGGTIILSVNGSIANTLNLRVNGGSGGNQLITNNEAEGPGGGGGGGTISISNGSPIRAANGGVNGTTTSTSLTEFTANGATRGGAGTTNGLFNVATIIDQPISSATGSDTYCGPYDLNAQSTSEHSNGTWIIVSGSGGTISDIHNPNATFIGDSLSTYRLVWQIDNNICQTIRDTFILTPFCMPLPVKLISFEAYQVMNQYYIEWQVADEIDINKYEIMVSYDGINFNSIGEIEALNSPNSYIHYDFINNQHLASKSTYYQLRITENNGLITYSNIVQLEHSNTQNGIKALYPNPTQKILNILIQGQLQTYESILITDIQGKIIQEVDLSKFIDQLIKINTEELQKGFYNIQLVKRSGLRFHSKFIKD
jgi:hypothetical protein